MDYLDIFYFLLLGSATGILSGLLGFGGGVFLVPFLFLIFQHLPLPHDRLMHLSIGTSLAVMIATAFASTWSHHKKKAVMWDTSKKMCPGIILGSVVGVVLARYSSSDFLAEFFGVFALLLSFYVIMPAKKEFTLNLPGRAGLNVLGCGLGILSSLLGIGGGTVAVPLLLAFRMPIRNAIATSSSLTVLTSIVGTIGYLSAGWGESFTDSFGFIYLPAFIIISLTTILCAPIGVGFAHVLPPKILKVLFAACLTSIAILMIFS